MPQTPPAAVAADLVAFLTDRLDEDRAQLRRLTDAAPTLLHSAGAGLRARDRLSAEIDAKRAVLPQLSALAGQDVGPNTKAVRDAALRALRALAGPYVGHPAYDPAWAAPHRR